MRYHTRHTEAADILDHAIRAYWLDKTWRGRHILRAHPWRDKLGRRHVWLLLDDTSVAVLDERRVCGACGADLVPVTIAGEHGAELLLWLCSRDNAPS